MKEGGVDSKGNDAFSSLSSSWKSVMMMIKRKATSLMIMMAALTDLFLRARNHSTHFAYIALFNLSQQLTEIDTSISYIFELRK